MRCLFCLYPPKRCTFPHFLLLLSNFFLPIKSQLYSLINHPLPFLRNTSNLITIFPIPSVVASALPYRYSQIFYSSQPLIALTEKALLLAYKLIAFTFQFHSFYPAISMILPSPFIPFKKQTDTSILKKINI